MKALWRIELWEGPKVQPLCGDASVVTRFRSRQAGALLAFLAFHRGQLYGREFLIEMLWSGCEPHAGRNRLSVVLSSLRSAFGTQNPSPFKTQNDRIGLDAPTIQTDVGEFRDALSAARSSDENARLDHWIQAVDLYGSSFLSDYDDEWIASTALALEDEFFAALHAAVIGCRKANRLDEALRLAKRGIEVDATREEAHRDLILVLAARGQGAAALRAGREAERLLRERLDSPLSKSMRALLHEIEQRLSAPISESSSGTKERATPHRLPTTWNRFFGREEELARLQLLLAEPHVRLITLSGPGGSGKTRLALELARQLEKKESVQSLWWLDGAALFEPQLLSPALCDVLGVTPGADATLTALTVLKRGPAILFFDNFEQLVPSALPWLQELIDGAPELRIVLSSRRVTRLSCEREWPVLPLAVPTELIPREGETWAAVELFCERARAIRPDFAVNERNRRAVWALCRRLDGLPLALELAAARVGLLSPAHILAHLEEGDALDSPSPDIAPRHRTLHNAIEWSVRLLSPELRAFWARLSTFRGGWTPDAASAVCGEKGVLNALSSLRDHSLIVADAAPDSDAPIRFRLLETTREFANELLVPSERMELGEAHARYFLSHVQRIEPLLLKDESERLMAWLHLEEDNLRVASEWAIRYDAEVALDLSARMELYWERRGHLLEAARWLEAALETASRLGYSTKTVLFGRAACELGRVEWLRGDLGRAQEVLELSIVAFEAQHDDIALAWSLNYLGLVETRRGETQRARALLDRALLIGRETNYRELIAEVLIGLVNLALMTGDLVLLKHSAPEKLAVQRDLRSRRGVAFSLLDVGLCAQIDGETARARACFEESLKTLRQVEDRWGMGQALAALGTIERLEGDFVQAREHFRAGLQLLRTTDTRWESVLLLDQFGFLAASVHQPEHAVTLLGAAHALREAAGLSVPPFIKSERERVLTQLSETIGTPQFEMTWQRSLLLEREAAFEIAMEI